MKSHLKRVFTVFVSLFLLLPVVEAKGKGAAIAKVISSAKSTTTSKFIGKLNKPTKVKDKKRFKIAKSIITGHSRKHPLKDVGIKIGTKKDLNKSVRKVISIMKTAPKRKLLNGRAIYKVKPDPNKKKGYALVTNPRDKDKGTFFKSKDIDKYYKNQK